MTDSFFRHQHGRLVAILSRMLGVDQIELIEDLIQETFLRALKTWPYHGAPENPEAWLVRVAKNLALDHIRGIKKTDSIESAAENTEQMFLSEQQQNPTFRNEIDDDILSLIFACCDPALSPDAQVALILKEVCGFSVSEIAAAFFANESTIAQRLVRAKSTLRKGHVTLAIPAGSELISRTENVLFAIYLLFNEGYSCHTGDSLINAERCAEAIRLCLLIANHPATASAEADALVALMSLHASRLPARVDASGDIVLLAEQDRTKWNKQLLALGFDYLDRARRGKELSRYHLEAGIAACHAVASDEQSTDWAEIVRLYDDLLRRAPSPLVELHRIIAIAKRENAEIAYELVIRLEADKKLSDYYLFHATKGFLLDSLGKTSEACTSYILALQLAPTEPEKQFLRRKQEMSS